MLFLFFGGGKMMKIAIHSKTQDLTIEIIHKIGAHTYRFAWYSGHLFGRECLDELWDMSINVVVFRG